MSTVKCRQKNVENQMSTEKKCRQCKRGKQEFRRMDFGSRLLAVEGEGGGSSESEGEGAVRVRGERTGVGEGEGCV